MARCAPLGLGCSAVGTIIASKDILEIAGSGIVADLSFNTMDIVGWELPDYP